MRSVIIELIQSCKNRILNAAGILRLYLRSFQQPVSDRILIVQIEKFNQGRYGFQLINYLHLAGYQIAFYKSTEFLSKLHGYDRLIFKLPGITIFKKKMINPHTTIDFLFYSTNKNVTPPVECNIKYELSLDYFNKKYSSSSSVLRLPFFIHPIMNQYLPVKKQKKRNRILFYGSDDAGYDSEVIKNRFQLMSRSEVYRIVEKSGLDFISPDSYEMLEQQLNDPEIKDAFFFLNSSKVWIPAQRWMSVLASFDFFIATPGIMMPHSHNIIEAMCAETVPVLQYVDWFFPPLIHEENSIYFKSEHELIIRIKEIFAAEPQKIAAMRTNTYAYYSAFINPRNFLAKAEAINQQNIELLFNAEELSLK